MEDLDSNSPHSDVERKMLEESSNFLHPEKSLEPVEISLVELPSKRIFAWCRDVVHDK